jgi:hypothetical protein
MKKPKDAQPNQALKEVHTSQGFVEAEVIRSYLESNGIRSVFKGSGAQSILPQTTNGMGAIKVCVLEKDLPLAMKLLKRLRINEREGK